MGTGTTVTLTAEDFEQTVTTNDIVLVDFWAEWCGPCRRFGPVFEAVAGANPDVVFGKVDTEVERGLSAAAGITSIPMLMAFRQGILVFAQPGALPQPALEDLLRQVRALDMDTVRASIEDDTDTSAEGGAGGSREGSTAAS